MTDIDRAIMVTAIQTVEMAVATEEQPSWSEHGPEYLATRQHAQALLGEAHARERQVVPELLPRETLAAARRGG